MNNSLSTSPLAKLRWPVPVVIFIFVLVAELWLVAGIATDIPYSDQWSLEGQWLYPIWCDGSFRAVDLLVPANEHRMVFTHALNLALFAANGQWDPLVQLAAIALVRATCAAGLAWMLCRQMSRGARAAMAAAVGIAFLPHLAWHTVVIESHSYFVVGFSLATFVLLGTGETSLRRNLLGLLAGLAALVAFGPAFLVPPALLALVLLRIVELRGWDRGLWQRTWPALVLLALAIMLRVRVSQHDAIMAIDWEQCYLAAGRMLAWPHVGQPLAALAVNLPLLYLLVRRVAQLHRPAADEDFVVLMAIWSAAMAPAAAWMRGGSGEFLFGVPSRYVDFIIFLPLANVWCVVQLMREGGPRARLVRVIGLAWAIFLLAGWVGLSTETWRGLIGPRLRDRSAPERLAREFQLSRNPEVFAGQPRLLIPHPNLGSVQAVLDDPRMQGKLPPSLQPERPQGPLSRAVRWLFGR